MVNPTPSHVAARRGLAARVGRALRVAAGLLLAGVAGLAVVLHQRHGGGQPYPDLSTPPLLAEDALERVLDHPEPIGNVAVAADGRVFFTVHPESRPRGARLWVHEQGRSRPYPDEASQRTVFDTVLGVAIDGRNRLWTIDHGEHGVRRARLLAFDLADGRIVHDHVFDATVAPLGSFLQDLQVDADGDWVYIADVSFWRKRPGLVVHDVRRRQSWRVLDGHASVMPQDWIVRTPAKAMVFFGGLVALEPGVDGIAIGKDGRWLHYAAMAHDTLYRIETAALREARDPAVAATLGDRVQAVARKPLNDGLSADLEGNVYVTDVEHGSVMRVTPAGHLQTVIRSPRIRWADALSFGPDGWLYVADSAIPEQMLRSHAHIDAQAPYTIWRFRPGPQGVPGQ